MRAFSERYLWYCVTTAFASFSVASLHWISRFSFPAMLSTTLRSSTSNLNSLACSASAASPLRRVAKSMRPVATQSRFTTPWLGNVFWLIQLPRPFGSGVQLFQAFGLGSQLFQAFGLGSRLFQFFASGSQLFQPFGSGSGSAISLSLPATEAKLDWM